MKKQYKSPEELSPGSIAKLIVNKFIKKETVDWKRDITCAKKLVALMPDAKFWLSLDKAQFDAMPQLLTERSINFLQQKYKLFHLELDKSPSYNLEKEKIGENKEVKILPRTLIDFSKEKNG